MSFKTYRESKAVSDQASQKSTLADLNKNTHFYPKNNKFKGKELTQMENTFEICNYYVHEEG